MLEIFEEVRSDYRFWELSSRAQKIVLSKKDPSFSKLSSEAQDIVLRKLELKKPLFDKDLDVQTGLTNVPLRIKLSFIDNPREREALLKTVYPETKRLPDGRLSYVNPETGRLTLIDEDPVSLRDLADWTGTIPEVIGGTVGSIGGAVSPVPGGAYIGAGAGTAAGRIVKKEIAEKIMGDFDIPESDKEYWTDIAIAGGIGIIGEAGGRLVIKGLSPFAKRIPAATKKAANYIRRFGGKLTPAQMTETRILDVLENVTESSLFGGGRIHAFKQSQREMIENIASDIAERFGARATIEEAGTLIQKTIMGNKKAFNVVARRLYEKVDKLANIQIPIKSLKSQAKTILKKIVPIEETTQKTLIPSLKNRTTAKLLRDFANLPDEVPFSYLQQWRSDLLQVGYGSSDLIPGKTQGIAKHLAKQIDNAFNNADSKLSGEGLQAFRKANAFWKKGKEIFNNSFIKTIVNKDPELISKSIFRRGAIQPIKKIKRMVNERTWRRLRGTYLNDLIFKQGLDSSGQISGKRIDVALRNMEESTLKEIFNPNELKELRHFVNATKLIQEKATGLGGGMLIQLTQAGAIMAPIMAPDRALTMGAAGILLGPAAMARIFTSDMGIKWLTQGLVTKATTKQGITLASRILALAGKEYLVEQQQPYIPPGP